MVEANFISVWKIPQGDAMPIAEAELDALRGWLSPEERQRADAFRGEGFKRDYVVAHAALRRILGECLDVAPGAVRFAAGSFREAGAAAVKPALMAATGGVGEGLDLRFNLSHTRGAAMAAVAVGFEIGIDVEHQRPMDDLEGMARTVMSDKEHGRWLALGSEEQMPAFYRLWTRKESYLKAIGLGLYHSLQDVTVPVSAGILEAGLGEFAKVEDRSRDDRWSVGDIPVAEEYSASVCWEGTRKVGIAVREIQIDTLLEVSAHL